VRTNNIAVLALRCCLVAGVIALVIGLILSETDLGEDILWVGALILIASPFVGVLTICIGLIIEKDWKWAKIAAVLSALIIIFMIIAFLLDNQSFF
jgi:hypothetical protein